MVDKSLLEGSHPRPLLLDLTLEFGSIRKLPSASQCIACNATRDMEQLHRVHCTRLNDELAGRDLAQGKLFRDFIGMSKRRDFWKLVAFGGWFFAGMLLAIDVIGRRS